MSSALQHVDSVSESSRDSSVFQSREETWQARLGVNADVSKVNLLGLLLHSAASIAFLVFLNSVQPFLLGQLGEHGRQGSLSGSLVFADESLSMILALVWGSTAQVYGTKPVALASFFFVAAGLAAYPLATRAWPDLLWARLVFAVGGSGATTMLSGLLASYSRSVPTKDSVRPPDSESTVALLRPESADGEFSPSPQPTRSGRTAALAGISTGCGALVGVFGLLRLPLLLTSARENQSSTVTTQVLLLLREEPDLGSPDDPAVRRGTREAFWVVSALALLVVLILSYALKSDVQSSPPAPVRIPAAQYGSVDNAQTPREARRARLRRRVTTSRSRAVARGIATVCRGSLRGLTMARHDGDLALAFLGGALARGITIAVTVFVPVLVTRYFYTSGLCSTLPSPDLPPSELKKACRAAFTVASILGGVIQLSALLLAPLAGYLCDATSPAVTLGASSAVGSIGFVILALGLPGGQALGEGDPRAPIAWVGAVCIGVSQIGAIVSSLALCVRARGRWDSLDDDRAEENREGRGTERGTKMPAAGAIAGAYSCTGGLSVLIVSKVGGNLSDLFTPAPFILLAGLSVCVCVWSIVTVSTRSQTR